MNAIEIAQALYKNNGKDFNTVFWDHLLNGIVLVSPSWFVMLKAVRLDEGDAWQVECAIGNLKEIARMILIHLPMVAFCRVKTGTDKLKVYRTSRLLRFVNREIRFA